MGIDAHDRKGLQIGHRGEVAEKPGFGDVELSRPVGDVGLDAFEHRELRPGGFEPFHVERQREDRPVVDVEDVAGGHVPAVVTAAVNHGALAAGHIENHQAGAREIGGFGAGGEGFELLLGGHGGGLEQRVAGSK